MENMNRFEKLSTVNVNEHTEKKNGLTYLSWAWAWSEFKRIFPCSFYTIYENSDGNNYFNDGKTCWVKTGVTLVDGDYQLELIEYLPVMDFKNSSIPLEKVTSFDVNKAIQRSLTKAVARHGLGLYIYAGEDLPEESTSAKEEAEKKCGALLISINPLITKLTAGMDVATKRNFANEHIVPYIGSVNFAKCKDPNQLEALLNHLKTLA